MENLPFFATVEATAITSTASSTSTVRVAISTSVLISSTTIFVGIAGKSIGTSTTAEFVGSFSATSPSIISACIPRHLGEWVWLFGFLTKGRLKLANVDKVKVEDKWCRNRGTLKGRGVGPRTLLQRMTQRRHNY